MKKLIATYATHEELTFFVQLAELAKPFFSLDYLEEQTTLANLTSYAGQLVISAQPLPQLSLFQLSTTPTQEGYLIPSLDLASFSQTQLFGLATYLSEPAVNRLDGLPLQATISNADNHIIYHNGQPTDPFLNDHDDYTPVADWILEEIKATPNHVSYHLLPSMAFDQILIQSYHGLYNDQQFTGVFQQVQDIRPLLAVYLQETGQALVGWSDTISGASIKNETFLDDPF